MLVKGISTSSQMLRQQLCPSVVGVLCVRRWKTSNNTGARGGASAAIQEDLGTPVMLTPTTTTARRQVHLSNIARKDAAATSVPKEDGTKESASELPNPTTAAAAGVGVGVGVGVSASTTAASIAAAKLALPARSDGVYRSIGESMVKYVLQQCDSGPTAFEECMQARKQLETVVHSIGYEMGIYTFGGIVVNGILENDGDVDFVGVGDVEPTFAEASEIIAKLSREMRRLGMKATSVAKARVPVVKVDRVSRAVPGSPLHPMSTWAIFQCVRPFTPAEQDTFLLRMANRYQAEKVEWNNSRQFASCKFPDTATLIEAITEVKRQGSVEIPLRLPLEPRNGPEIYRYPFDLCLNTTGLRNSYLFREYVMQVPYARHMLMIIKRWGRASGVVNSIDGLLASYALTVMLLHFFVRMKVISPVDPHRITHEPQLLPKEPPYVPLEELAGASAKSGEGLSDIGYLLMKFFEYYGTEFDFSKNVICTTNENLSKSTLQWDFQHGDDGAGRPPFYHFAIKDPYGNENIARNLNAAATRYVQKSMQMAFQRVAREVGDPAFLVHSIVTSPPKPSAYHDARPGGFTLTPEQEARRELKKIEFHQRKDKIHRFGQKSIVHNEKVRAAQDMTKSLVDWIQSSKQTE